MSTYRIDCYKSTRISEIPGEFDLEYTFWTLKQYKLRYDVGKGAVSVNVPIGQGGKVAPMRCKVKDHIGNTHELEVSGSNDHVFVQYLRITRRSKKGNM